MIKFSVIIPAYNVEEFIKKCLNSVVNQTYKNYEVIVVNDGSTDNTLKIINEYEKKYKKMIKVINKENGGLSSARNEGVKIATGDYIIFLDSDDWWEKDLLEVLNKNMKDNIDIIGFKLQKYYENDNKYECVNIPTFDIINGKKALQKYIESHVTFETAVTFAFKSSFWKKNKFLFSIGKYHEDFGLTPYVIAKADKVCSINYIGYNYLKRDNSITSVDNYEKELKKAMDTLFHVNYLKNKFLKLNLDNYTRELVANFLMNTIIKKTIELNKKDQNRIYKKLKDYKIYELFNNTNIKSYIKYLLIKINPKNYKIFI